VPLSWHLGTLTSWNPLGHSRPVTGLLYLYLYLLRINLNAKIKCTHEMHNVRSMVNIDTTSKLPQATRQTIILPVQRRKVQPNFQAEGRSEKGIKFPYRRSYSSLSEALFRLRIPRRRWHPCVSIMYQFDRVPWRVGTGLQDVCIPQKRTCSTFIYTSSVNTPKLNLHVYGGRT